MEKRLKKLILLLIAVCLVLAATSIFFYVEQKNYKEALLKDINSQFLNLIGLNNGLIYNLEHLTLDKYSNEEKLKTLIHTHEIKKSLYLSLSDTHTIHSNQGFHQLEGLYQSILIDTQKAIESSIIQNKPLEIDTLEKYISELKEAKNFYYVLHRVFFTNTDVGVENLDPELLLKKNYYELPEETKNFIEDFYKSL
jgi:hypothetical protein